MSVATVTLYQLQKILAIRVNWWQKSTNFVKVRECYQNKTLGSLHFSLQWSIKKKSMSYNINIDDHIVFLSYFLSSCH